MLIDFSQIKEVKIPGMNDGTGKAVCNGQEEILNAGTCHICKFPSRYNRTYSSGSSMASAFNAQSDPGVVFKSFSASQQSMRSI